MLKLIYILLIIFYSINIFSNEPAYKISISYIDDTDTQLSAIYASDGRVYNVSNTDQNLLNKLRFAFANDLEVQIDFGRFAKLNEQIDSDKREEIFEAELSSTEVDSSIIKNKSFYKNAIQEKEKIEVASLQNSYVTDFNTMEELEDIFQGQRKSFRSRSQCYNRAHVWSWELNKKYYGGKKIQPGKMWIFYSRDYIRKYDFKWWFHVSPYATVNKEEKILDRTFLKSPSSAHEWVNHLSRVKITCHEVKNYSSYRQETTPADCYFIKTSLYYWQPWQIKNVEEDNQEREGWNGYELKKAYKNGVGWFSDVP